MSRIYYNPSKKDAAFTDGVYDLIDHHEIQIAFRGKDVLDGKLRNLVSNPA